MEVPTFNELNKFKVPELRAQLSDYGLPTTGNKPVLVQRLHDHLTSRAAGEVEGKEAPAPVIEEAEETGAIQSIHLTAPDSIDAPLVESEQVPTFEDAAPIDGVGEDSVPVENEEPQAMEEEPTPTEEELVPSEEAIVEVPEDEDPVAESVEEAVEAPDVTPTVDPVFPAIPPPPVVLPLMEIPVAKDEESSEKPEEETEEPAIPSQPVPPPIQRGPQIVGQTSTDETADPEAPPKLPSALENILSFKDLRAKQVGQTSADAAISEGPSFEDEEERRRSYSSPLIPPPPPPLLQQQQQQQPPSKQPKEAKQTQKKKKKRKTRGQRMREMEASRWVKRQEAEDDEEDDVEVEYVPEDLGLDPKTPAYRLFHKIFEAFKISEKEEAEETKGSEEGAGKDPDKEKETENKEEEEEEDEKPEEEQKISKKKLKKMTRLSVAELKQLVSRPDVVEMHDVTARDPKLLVHLKSTRNSVPVPRHWCFKRKYLQGKRGIEKPPFDLPDFIKKTGIMEMRQALQDKETEKSLKSKMREKVRPKLGKIDIDYQKLHDAFFKWQTKPRMTIHGDLYYEGKEFETRLKEKKPGILSDDMRIALGMPVGPNAERFPPPWLISMQRYGPPPSYPTLKIPGLNSPIPDGCSFGYHAGGWGKPPVDERGRPLYGDVFGVTADAGNDQAVEEEIDRSHWGELESESSEESESESEEEEEEKQGEASGLATPGPEGMITPSGLTSMPVGIETPDVNIQLRKTQKANIEAAMEAGDERPSLYQVLPEKRSAVGGAMMGSAHVYDMSAATAMANRPAAVGPGDRDRGDIEVALNPEELDLDPAEMAARYEQRVREQQSHLAKDRQDLSDMVAEHAAKQKKKRKAAEGKEDLKSRDSKGAPAAKKYKEFKF